MIEGLLGIIAVLLLCILLQLVEIGKRARRDAEETAALLQKIENTLAIHASETSLYRLDKDRDPAEKQASEDYWNSLRGGSRRPL